MKKIKKQFAEKLEVDVTAQHICTIKYRYIWRFPLLFVDVISTLSLPRLLADLIVYMSNTAGVL